MHCIREKCLLCSCVRIAIHVAWLAVARPHRHHDLSIRLVMMSCFPFSIHHTAALSSRSKAMGGDEFMAYVSFPCPIFPFSRQPTHAHKHKHNDPAPLYVPYHAPLFPFDIRIQRDIHEYRVGCVCAFRVRVSVVSMSPRRGARLRLSVSVVGARRPRLRARWRLQVCMRSMRGGMWVLRVLRVVWVVSGWV